MRKAILYILIAASAISWTPVSAQLPVQVDLDKLGYKELVHFDMYPEHPAPGDSVKVNISSPDTDISSSDVSWTMDGTVKMKGKGITTYSFTAGPLGKPMVLAVVIMTPEGKQVVERKTIVPSDVDILWQAETYTPPFYKGKAQYTYNSAVTLVAMPHIVENGAELPPSQVHFTWKVNGETYGSDSGVGRNTFTAETARNILPVSVEVTAKSIDGKMVARRQTTVKPVQPAIYAYKKHPLYGIIDDTAFPDSKPMTEREVTVVVRPYFFSTSPAGSEVKYVWNLNNAPLKDTTGPSIVLRNEMNTEGTSLISVRATHAEKWAQSANSSFTLSFTKSDGEPAVSQEN